MINEPCMYQTANCFVVDRVLSKTAITSGAIYFGINWAFLPDSLELSRTPLPSSNLIVPQGVIYCS